MERIIYIVDKKGSALHTSALARVSLSGGRVYIANEYISPRNLLKNIYNENHGVILFAWRKALADAINLKSSRSYLEELETKFITAFLIPDHLGLADQNEKKELEMINAVDYYLVTSQKLLNAYRKRFVDNPPEGVLHDLPNLNTIEHIKKNIQKIKGDKPKIIWVGNSGWGARQGSKDHKGLVEKILPLKEVLKNHNDCMDLEIVDSRKKFVEHIDVLAKIRTADLLIQVSRSEGTGLPLLEAIGLETLVLSTNVGVAKEILSEPYQFIESTDGAEEIHSKIHEFLGTNSTEMLSESFRNYIAMIQKEVLVPTKKVNILPACTSLKKRVEIRLFWYYRYFANLAFKKRK